MSLVKKFLSGFGRSSRKSEEQVLEIHLELTGGDYGSEDEVEEIRLLGDDCETALREAGAGTFEGEEFGGSACVLVFSGPDAGRLLGIVGPIFRASRLAGGAQVVQRLGGSGARDVRSPLG